MYICTMYAYNNIVCIIIYTFIYIIIIHEHFVLVRLQRPLLTSPQSSNPFLVNEERHSASEIGLEAIAAEAGRRTSCKFQI